MSLKSLQTIAGECPNDRRCVMTIEGGFWYAESASWWAIGFIDDMGNLAIVRSGSFSLPSPCLTAWDM
jgi:hypothetical protein